MAALLEFRKIREFGEIIDDSFAFLKQNFKPLMKTLVYLCGFFILAGIVISVMSELAVVNEIAKNTEYGERSMALSTINKILTCVLALLTYTAVTACVISYIALYVEKGNVPPAIDEVWAYFKYYYLRVLVAALLVGFFMVVCFVFLLLPGIYVFPVMSLFFPIMIFENASAGYSFGRAFKLIKDQWWITAGTILVMYVITYMFTLLAVLPAILVGFMSGFMQAESAKTIVVVVTAIAQYLCFLMYVLPLIGASFCYFNLQERLESTGLLQRIADMGKHTTAIRSNSIQEEY